MDEAYVAFVTNKIYIKNVNEEYKQKLLKLNSSVDENYPEYWTIEFTSKEDKSSIFTKLRDIKVLFSSGKDWSPSEQFEYYRAEGLISGLYHNISWRNVNEYVIEEK